MKIRFETAALTPAASWIGKGIVARPTQKEMGNVVIQTLGDTAFVGVTSTDGEYVGKACVPVEVITKGVIAVPGKLLAEIAGKLRGTTAELSLESGKAVITCGSKRYYLPLGDVSMHPQGPKPDGPEFSALPEATGRVSAEAFGAAVAQVAQAASKDAAAPQGMSGVQVRFTPEKIVLTATDRYRVATREIAWTPSDAEAEEFESLVIPATRLADAVEGLTQVTQGEITLALPSEDTRSVTFGGRGRVASSRTLGQEFPKCAELMATCEKAATLVAELDAAEFTKAITDLRVGDKTRLGVRLTFAENTCLIEADNDAQAEDSVDCGYDGDEISISFNSEYLLAGVAAAGTPKVRLAMSAPNRPALLTGDVAGFRYMVMPVLLQAKPTAS